MKSQPIKVQQWKQNILTSLPQLKAYLRTLTLNMSFYNIYLYREFDKIRGVTTLFGGTSIQRSPRHRSEAPQRKEHLDIYSKKEDVPINDHGEKLISLSGISEKIKMKPMYFLNNIPGSLNDCFAREGAVERLLEASERLPENHHFIIFDAWRPYQVQMELYEQLKEKLQSRGLENESLHKELSQYVDRPAKDPMRPSNHLTGGAIDLTIATLDGPLDMGTGFDDFTEKSHTDAYENIADANEKEARVRDNRRLLKSMMENAGFTNYEKEWWHYDYGNQNWGKATGNTAFYGGVINLKEHLALK